MGLLLAAILLVGGLFAWNDDAAQIPCRIAVYDFTGLSLFEYDAAGMLTPTESLDVFPLFVDWTADGRALTFLELRPDGVSLRAVGDAGPLWKLETVIRLTFEFAAQFRMRLHAEGLPAQRPLWSPDGAYIAWQATRPTPDMDPNSLNLVRGDTLVVVLELATGETRQSGPVVELAGWTPDGRVLYQTGDALVAAAPDTLTEAVVIVETSTDALVTNFALSPDGTRVAFWRNRADPIDSFGILYANDLVVRDLNTGIETSAALTMAPFAPVWSPACA